MRPLHTLTGSLVSSVILVHHITVIRLHNQSTCFEGTHFLPQVANVSPITALLYWAGGPGTRLRLYVCGLYLTIWSRRHHFPLHDDAVCVLLPCLYIPPTDWFWDFPCWELNFHMQSEIWPTLHRWNSLGKSDLWILICLKVSDLSQRWCFFLKKSCSYC